MTIITNEPAQLLKDSAWLDSVELLEEEEEEEAGGGEPAAEDEPGTPPAENNPPANEPPAEEKGDPQPDPTSVEDLYDGSDFFDAATEIFTKAGINGQVIVDHFQNNDGEFAQEHIDLMVKRLGKAQTQLMLDGIENEIQGQAQAEQVTVQSIYEAVGGQENFEQAAAWAASEASGWDDAERGDMNEMLNMGGNFSAWAAQLMMIGFTNAGGQGALPITNAPNLKDGKSAPPKGIEPIKFSEYREAINNAKSQGEVDGIVKRANHTMKMANKAEFGWKY